MPEENLLGELNQGFYLIMANFQGERLGMALGALGEMRATFEDVGRSGRRRPPSVWRPAQDRGAWTQIEAGRGDDLRRAAPFLAGQDTVREVTMAKLLTQRANLQVQEDCLQMRGIEGAGASRPRAALRDSRLGRSAAARTRS